MHILDIATLLHIFPTNFDPLARAVCMASQLSARLTLSEFKS
jgi:hypothetical protein